MVEQAQTGMRPVLIAAGGTGGHVFPALAVAQQLIAAGVEVLWVGTVAGIEARVVPAAGIELRTINVSGFRGKNLLRRLFAPLQLALAVVVVLQLAFSRKVACVLATGGYVSAAGGIAAMLSRKPFLLQEQNAVAGTTNRMLSPFARKVFTAYPQVLEGSGKVECIGNPLRANFRCLPTPLERGVASGPVLNLLVLGGSLGARILNGTVPGAIAQVGASPGSFTSVHVVHQGGEQDRQKIIARYRELGIDAEVFAFIEDMPAALQRADLVIARAGALTLSEICAVGVAAILVPLPHAIDDHQTVNARWLETQGAAVLLPQSELSEQRLAEKILALVSDRERLSAIAAQSRAQARADAASHIANACMHYAGAAR
ncbi:MAG: undecaprenyldiphospho-muramoylpentapeptide beta-N-acetylglucosaminyltransferase [Pseudomonadales bacterium]